jgi:hypothetical protein
VVQALIRVILEVETWMDHLLQLLINAVEIEEEVEDILTLQNHWK